MYPLYVIKKNNYGNAQTTETCIKDAEKLNFYELKGNDYWSIKDPSDNVKYLLATYHPNHTIYKSKGGMFAISPIASQFYKPEDTGQGSGIVIEFADDNSEYWYLLVSDDKPYVSNVQGASEPGESFEQCIKREVKEETLIDLSNITPIPIASYSFMFRNALVDCEYKVTSQIYYALLQWDSVKHLFGCDKEKSLLVPNKINIIDANKFLGEHKLDEVKYIIAIPTTMDMSNIPEKFDEIQITKVIKDKTICVHVDYSKISHHRQFIDLFDTNDPIVKPPFLDSITFDKRRAEALFEFIMQNPL